MGAFLPVMLGPVGRYAAAGLFALAIAGFLVGVGIRFERAQVLVAVARAEKAEADAMRLAETAQANADSAKALAADNEAQALAYAADAETARSDRDEIDLARQAAAIAAKACATDATPLVDDEVHRALRGQAASEDDGQPASLKAAMDALRAKPKRRRK